MDIAEEPENQDITIERDGLRVFLEKMAGNMLSGATIDYSDDRGFIIIGMPQTSCCG